jgi:hypothetical protein
VSVRADQQGVGRPVIGSGGADVDAMLPIPGGLAQVRPARSRRPAPRDPVFDNNTCIS